MSFVFYDTETTGISTDFDQILQFAAIRTDADLNEIDRVEMRCRLLPHVVPHPGALKVTGMSIARITDGSLPCHYEMIRTIREKLLDWSPSIFIGYNSMNFDEHLLRQALFRTLHAPYLTNTGGNGRADAMTLIQTATQFAPGCIEVPLNPKGKPVFKLDRLAPANGFAHDNAHDALADVEATIHLAKCVRDRAPECWQRFVSFSSKAGVARFMASVPAFVLTEFYYNKPFHFIVGALGADPDNPAVQLCLDLRHDLDSIAGLSDADMAEWMTKSPKPIRKLKTNSGPSIAPMSAASHSMWGDLTPAAARAAVQRLQVDAALRQRLIRVATSAREAFPESPHVEEQLYSAFIPDGDTQRMNAFHAAPWNDRVSIVDALEDRRLRYYGYRLVYERHPELLRHEIRAFFATHDRERLMDATGTAKWGTLHAALEEIPEARADCSGEVLNMLDEYEVYLRERIAFYRD